MPGTTILPALRAIDTPEACSADLVAGLCNGEKIKACHTFFGKNIPSLSKIMQHRRPLSDEKVEQLRG